MGRKTVIVVAAVALIVAAFAMRSARKGEPENAALHTGEESGLPRLVDLGSDQCIPCKKMMPILEALADEYRGALVVEFIDVRKDPDAGEPWGVRVIPTQVFVDPSGRELFRHEGFFPKEAILEKWAELGVDLRPARGAES